MAPLSRSVLLFLAAAQSIAASKYKTCQDQPLIDVTSVDISPVIPGETLTVTVEGVSQVYLPNTDIEIQVSKG